MKSLVTLMALALCLNTYSYERKVYELADSGNPELKKDSDSCPRRYSNQSYTDLLGQEDGHNTLCVKHVKLPLAVLSEIREMKSNELENESDYDQRVTALYVFEQSSFTNGGVDSDSVKELAEKLGIPKSQIQGPTFRSFVANANSFSQFEGLALGEDYFMEQTESLKYLRTLLKGETILSISFGDGIELYPGGGFNVTHYLFLTKNKVVYVKLSWWDA